MQRSADTRSNAKPTSEVENLYGRIQISHATNQFARGGQSGRIPVAGYRAVTQVVIPRNARDLGLCLQRHWGSPRQEPRSPRFARDDMLSGMPFKSVRIPCEKKDCEASRVSPLSVAGIADSLPWPA